MTYEEVKAIYDAYYGKEQFVRVLDKDVCPETKWVEGSGIGLSIVRKIIEDHGGKIWANSKLGCGTVMYFVLRKYQEVPVNEQNTNHRR